jgi:uroporphyrin-III C-methyltransferase / precorrin-2 dehydrogenase / sirohydrochlorin ferrochelatase
MFLPLYFETDGLTCLIIGGGRVAARKVEMLLAASCALTVIAPQIDDRIRTYVDRCLLTWHAREYSGGDCRGFRLVIAATPNEAVNRAVSVEARQFGIPVNVVDTPELCTVIFGASWSDGPLTISVSTGGRAPFMAAAVRDRISETAAGIGRWVEAAETFRAVVRSSIKDPDERERLFRRFAAHARVGSPAVLPAGRRIEDWLDWLERCKPGG